MIFPVLGIADSAPQFAKEDSLIRSIGHALVVDVFGIDEDSIDCQDCDLIFRRLRLSWQSSNCTLLSGTDFFLLD